MKRTRTLLLELKLRAAASVQLIHKDDVIEAVDKIIANLDEAPYSEVADHDEESCGAWLAQELLLLLRKSLYAGATSEVTNDGHGWNFTCRNVDGCQDLRVIVTDA